MPWSPNRPVPYQGHPTIYVPNPVSSTYQVQLQSLIAGYSGCDDKTLPHHPISCYNGKIALYENNVMECEHAKADKDNKRTQHALDAALAILLLEEAYKKFG